MAKNRNFVPVSLRLEKWNLIPIPLREIGSKSGVFAPGARSTNALRVRAPAPPKSVLRLMYRELEQACGLQFHQDHSFQSSIHNIHKRNGAEGPSFSIILFTRFRDKNNFGNTPADWCITQQETSFKNVHQQVQRTAFQVLQHAGWKTIGTRGLEAAKRVHRFSYPLWRNERCCVHMDITGAPSTQRASDLSLFLVAREVYIDQPIEAALGGVDHQPLVILDESELVHGLPTDDVDNARRLPGIGRFFGEGLPAGPFRSPELPSENSTNRSCACSHLDFRNWLYATFWRLCNWVNVSSHHLKGADRKFHLFPGVRLVEGTFNAKA